MSDDVLLTDLYELTMLKAYFAQGMRGRAVFELFVRKLPSARGFLVAAGLAQAIELLENLNFAPDAIASVASLGQFDEPFLRGLAELRFRGDVDAVPEGTILFENEPILRVTAEIGEAQLVETRLVNIVHFQTIVASKAARCVLAAPGKQLIDFGVRRAHGFEAGLLAARAAYLAGFDGTSTVLAAVRYGIPAHGTMAHSFVQAHEDELDAFRSFAASYPGRTVLLIDTYDTEQAAHKVVLLAREGVAIRGVRIDSGDLAAHARAVRRILDEGGLHGCTIFASGGLDEHAIVDLVAHGAPIDGFGVGTQLDTSGDAPSLDCAYKLVEYAGRPTRKRSEGKATLPGPKQVFRRRAPNGLMTMDVVTIEGEAEQGEPLLVPVMRRGRRVGPAESLDVIRRRVRAELSTLPPHLGALAAAPRYPVRISPALERLAHTADARGRGMAPREG